MKIILSSISFLFVLCLSIFPARAQKTPKPSKYPGYEIVGSFNNGLAKVKKDKKWGYIDTTGNVVFPCRYNEVENFSDGLARVRVGTKWGLISSDGTEVIKPTFDWIYEFVDGIALVKLEGEEYYMNKKGQRVVK